MPFCRECGSTVGITDKFCSKCGADQPISTTLINPFRGFPAKNTINFGNGLVIGAGIVLLLGGLFMASVLDSLFNTLNSYLATQGSLANNLAVRLLDIARTISLCAFVAVMGAYLLVFGCIYQFSPKARAFMSIKSTTARFGASLTSFGFIFIVLPFSNYIYDLYIRPQAPVTIYLVMATFGSIVLAVGVILTAIAYYRSRKKVQNPKIDSSEK